MIHFHLGYSTCLFTPLPPLTSLPPSLAPIFCLKNGKRHKLNWCHASYLFHFSCPDHFALHYGNCAQFYPLHIKIPAVIFYFFLIFWSHLSLGSLFFCSTEIINIYSRMPVSLNFFFLSFIASVPSVLPAFFCSFYWSLSFVRDPCLDIWWL